MATKCVTKFLRFFSMILGLVTFRLSTLCNKSVHEHQYFDGILFIMNSQLKTMYKKKGKSHEVHLVSKTKQKIEILTIATFTVLQDI